MKCPVLVSAALSAVLLGSAASAQTEATASTDLNIRSGPGPWYEVVGVIPGDGSVSVDGCLEEANWCQVTHEGTSGWAYGDYLSVSVGEQPMTLTAPEPRQTVATVTYEDTTGRSAAVGAGFGTVAGAIVGGPVGAAVGAAVGAGAAAAADPGPQVTTFVTSNPVEPVYLEGEVVVGAGLPPEVQVYEVPESDFVYANVNGVPVIVEPNERTIVTIVR